MELITVYNTYSQTNKKLIEWLDKQVAIDFDDNQEVIADYLKNIKVTLENLLQQTESMEVEETYKKDLKDLQYLVADTLFLTDDLRSYYQYKEIGRLKMRAINYMNKRRRAELFGQ